MTGINYVLTTALRAEGTSAAAELGAQMLRFAARRSPWVRNLLRRIMPNLNREDQGVPTPQVPDFRVSVPFKLPLPENKTSRWGLLLPISSRGALEEECWTALKAFSDSLLASTSTEDRSEISVFVGIDEGDVVYDNRVADERLRGLFAASNLAGLHFFRFTPAYSGKLCWIWDALARAAVEAGSDFFVLLGDDIDLKTEGWKREIEGQFEQISREQQLPFGVACVAFRDEAFPVFPTFPVLHRTHFHIFGELFPSEFVNQHGDPYLFEVYRRWGASRFAPNAALCNKLGGKKAARYNKRFDLIWRDELLTKAVGKVSSWLQDRSAGSPAGIPPVQIPCIDCVVPTYRCDPSMLRRIALLKCEGASVQTIIVVDRPDTPNMREIKALERYTPNSLVRVVEMPKNEGASAARNRGLAQSFGDHAVLLDDDVVPDPNILEAYVGAILRYPGSTKVFVGCTTIPPPRTWMQRAMKICGICFFYDVSERMRHPPWGVTANLCVASRTNNRVWFGGGFPKTGGGEDVDYCFRLKGRGNTEGIVSVPGARAEHPFWTKILKQVSGWASGDVMCLETLPYCTFYAFPDWSELILFYSIYSAAVAFCGTSVYGPVCSFFVFASTVSVTDSLLRASVHVQHDKHRPLPERVALSLLATLPETVQDSTRLLSKVSRLKMNQVCMHFDWMDGQGQHVIATKIVLLLRGSIVLLFAASVMHPSTMWLTGAPCACLVAFWLCENRRAAGRSLAHQANIISKPTLDPIPFPAAAVSRCRPFVVLTSQRTGSNLLCALLSHHPEIAMHNELFHYQHIYSPGWRNRGGWTPLQRDAEPFEFLIDALAGSGTIRSGKSVRAVGFKLFPEHWHAKEGRHELFESLVADPSVLKVVLVRESRLDVCTSMMRTGRSGKYVGDNLDNLKFEIQPREFQTFAQRYDSTFEYYRSSLNGQAFCEITYEQLTGEKDATMHRLLSFLGVSTDVNLGLNERDGMVKQTTRPAKESIVNFDSLEFAFRHSKYAKDFH
mmetsp:Transcript_9930/g.23952  ORF Transcript_9930/g.23952 Transcript_9930/m.23952 type:complete len:1010 (-) Transcript_9930:296-3325(-)